MRISVQLRFLFAGDKNTRAKWRARGRGRRGSERGWRGGDGNARGGEVSVNKTREWQLQRPRWEWPCAKCWGSVGQRCEKCSRNATGGWKNGRVSRALRPLRFNGRATARAPCYAASEYFWSCLWEKFSCVSYETRGKRAAGGATRKGGGRENGMNVRPVLTDAERRSEETRRWWEKIFSRVHTHGRRA